MPLIPSIAPDVGIGRPLGATNLVSNGGMTTNTTGWTTGGTNTIARSTEQAKFGAASLKATYSNSVQMATYALVFAGAGTYFASVWVYIPADFDGALVNLRFDSYAGATGTLIVNANMAIVDAWQEIVVPSVGIVAGDLSGSLQVRGITPTAGKFLYVDGLQVATVYAPYVETDGAPATRKSNLWIA